VILNILKVRTDAIDVLIGSDHYRDIVTGDIIRGKGPIEVHSKLGWLYIRGCTYLCIARN